MSNVYGQWTLKQLKAELMKRNAKITGKKATLVLRLQSYDDNFGTDSIEYETSGSFQMLVPEFELFEDINSDTCVLSITSDVLQLFSELCEQSLNVKALNMYKERYLLTIRSATQNTYTYVSGRCASEYRKHVVYEVYVKINSDAILETQCECAAGMGPNAHCKHVLVVINAIVNFSGSKTILLQESCTSVLQSFHKPKKYFGAPIKAVDLKLKKIEKNQVLLQNFDPRPRHFRKQPHYEAFFKNLTVGFAAHHPNCKQMPIIEIIPPANKYAINIDHAYEKSNIEDTFLKCYKKSVIELTEIEAATRDQSKSKLWLKERSIRLQSSNFGMICKSTVKTDKKKLAASLLKTSAIRTLAIRHGLKYEKVAIKKFKLKMKKASQKCGVFVHPLYQFLGSSPDGIVDDDTLLEVKCPFTAKDDKINPETVPYIYLCEQSGKLQLLNTHNYYYQIQGQMLCTGKSKTFLVIYTLVDFLVITVERNDKFIENMNKDLVKFFEEYFKQAVLDKHVYKNYRNLFC